MFNVCTPFLMFNDKETEIKDCLLFVKESVILPISFLGFT